MASARPRLTIPRSIVEIVCEAASVAGVLLGLLTATYAWPQLPDSIPTHFNFAGDADGWGGKGGLFILPAVAGGLYALLTALSFVPHIWNYPVRITEENAERQYKLGRTFVAVLKVELVWTFVAIEWALVAGARAGRMPGGSLMVVAPMVLLGVTITVYFVRAFRTR